MSSAQDNGGPAFPFIDSASPLEHSGMTLRDYFAGRAMQAWLPAWERSPDFDLCERAYKLADAMVKAREA